MKWFAATVSSLVAVLVLANVVAALFSPSKVDPTPVLATHKFATCKFPKTTYPLSKADEAALISPPLNRGYFETSEHLQRFRETVLPKASQLLNLMAQTSAAAPKGTICVNPHEEVVASDAGGSTMSNLRVAAFVVSYLVYEWETRKTVPANQLTAVRNWLMYLSRHDQIGLATVLATRGKLMGYVVHRDARFKRVVDAVFPKSVWFDQIADTATNEVLLFNMRLNDAPVPFRDTPLANVFLRVKALQNLAWEHNAAFISTYKTNPCPSQHPKSGLAVWEYLDCNIAGKWTFSFLEDRLEDLHAMSCNVILHDRMLSKETGLYEPINYQAMPIAKK